VSTKYIKNVDSEWFRHRLATVMLAVSLAFAVLTLRLLYLQIVKGQEYRRLSINNSIRLQDIEAPRGFIYDRHGVLLADNRPSFDLYISLKDARPIEPTLRTVSTYLQVPFEELLGRAEAGQGGALFNPLALKIDTATGCRALACRSIGCAITLPPVWPRI
jgi:penicillin-binding protein 2